MKRSSRSRTTQPKPSGNEPNKNRFGLNPSGSDPSQGETTYKRQLEKIISGGQTGVDRAALDAAIELGIPHGGWCPRGRRAEDGAIPTRYQLKEIEGIDYSERTRRNILESDATLILTSGPLQGGTLLTFNLCNKLGRPVRVVQLEPQQLASQQLTLQPNAYPRRSPTGTDLVSPDSSTPCSLVPSTPDSLSDWLAKSQAR
ncbi:MAG: putative molybdenum carrier protein, partial [Pirellula sp.]